MMLSYKLNKMKQKKKIEKSFLSYILYIPMA